MNSLNRYNKFQMFLHWVTAAGVVFLLFTGVFFLEPLANQDPAKVAKLQIHAMVGAAVLLLTITRLIWALVSAQPVQSDSGRSMASSVAKFAPKVLNGLVLILALSGVLMGLYSGLFDLLINDGGTLPSDFSGPARTVHAVSSKLLIAAVCVHVVAAIVHQVIFKHRVFERILPI